MNRFEDMALLLAPESIRNLKGVPLTIFNKITSVLGFEQVV